MAVTLFVMMCISYESKVLCLDNYFRVGRLVEESTTKCVIVHYVPDRES